MTEIVIAGPGQQALAQALERGLGCKTCPLELRQFPDGESHVVVGDGVTGARVWLVWSLHQPDQTFLPMAMVAQTARDLGARAIVLVAPYLPYMRQDARWRAGEGVSSRYFAAIVSQSVDAVLTVDPHLHRTPSLEPLFSIPAHHVSAAQAIAAWIEAQGVSPLIIGPDEESAQWAEAVAQRLGAPAVIFEKTRSGDRDVRLERRDLSGYAGRTPFIIDDIISTGRTMLQAIEQTRAAQLAAPTCVGVHAVFADDAARLLLDAGAARVITCDSITHSSNMICVADTLVSGAQALIARLS